MSTEFRPIETVKPAPPAWIYALAGAAIAAFAMWFMHREKVPASAQQVVASANVAPDVKPADLKLTETPAAPKAAESPNVLNAAASAVSKVAMVARAELDRELGRTQAARREAVAYRRQLDDVNQKLTEARAQIAALQRAKQPPPPSDREQILQMLAPVLKASNDGRP